MTCSVLAFDVNGEIERNGLSPRFDRLRKAK